MSTENAAPSTKLLGVTFLNFRSGRKIQVGCVHMVEEVGERFLSDDYGQFSCMGI